MRTLFSSLGILLVLSACMPQQPASSSASSSSSGRMEDETVMEGGEDAEGFQQLLKEEEQEAMEQNSENAEDKEEDAMERAASSSSSKAAAATGKPARVIEVNAENWEFSPKTITIKKGEKVTIKLVGESGLHGFLAAGLKINQKVSVGETVNISIPTDVSGTFEFVCSVPCGPGHSEMVGQIIIEE